MPAPQNEPIRLSRRISEMANCSRREAELYIEGGWVTVNGVVVDVPGTRVLHETVVLDPKGVAAPVPEVTILLHKPVGFETSPGAAKPVQQLLAPRHMAPSDRSGIRPVRRHFDQECLTPLEPAATGLVLFSQDWRIRRKLVEDAAVVEHELVVDVLGEVGPDTLHRLSRAPVIDGRAMTAAKVSINRQTDKVTGLRFASKGHWPGRIAQMCDAESLQIVAMKRMRIGRITLSGLEPGQWRYLLPYEKI